MEISKWKIKWNKLCIPHFQRLVVVFVNCNNSKKVLSTLSRLKTSPLTLRNWLNVVVPSCWSRRSRKMFIFDIGQPKDLSGSVTENWLHKGEMCIATPCHDKKHIEHIVKMMSLTVASFVVYSWIEADGRVRCPKYNEVLARKLWRFDFSEPMTPQFLN